MSRQDVYSQHADTIEAVITAVCRRHRLPAEQAEDLASQIRLKLLKDDAAVLRRFEGRASMRTYLVTVAERVLMDWRVHEWGKWRPCQEARRLGPLAVELDRLLTRDSMPYEEAVELLVARGQAQSRGELDAIRPRLANRTGRWKVGGEVLEFMPAPQGAADDGVAASEHETRVMKAGTALAAALAELSPEDQIILRLRFQDGFTVARIAALIGEDQKPLYRRFERLYARLKEALTTAGVTEEDIGDLFGGPALDLPPALDAVTGNPGGGPSRRMTPGGRHA